MTDVEQLEKRARVAEELLYLVLCEIGQPVELTSETLARGRVGDSMIDLTLDQQRDIWVLQVVDIAAEEALEEAVNAD